MGSCVSQGNCAVLGLVILRITFAIWSKIGLGFFLVFFNFHFFAKVWSLKLLAINFARDVNALGKVLRMSSTRHNCDQKSLRKKGAIVCMHMKEKPSG
jgi:hypothetical protein